MASSLPTFPKAIFTVVEPISLLAGFIGAVYDTEFFVKEQYPSTLPIAVTQNSKILAWQLGNTYLLMGFVGLGVLLTTSELRVVKSYLFALWLGDIGHIFFSCYGLGWDKVTDAAQWNSLFAGNVLFTAFLFLTRSLYFLGLFGSSGPAETPSSKKQK